VSSHRTFFKGNALCERQNRTLQDILSKYTNHHQKDWDLYLPMATYAINSASQTSTAQSPFFSMYRRHPSLPLDVTMPILQGPNEESLRTDDALYNAVYQETAKRLKIEQARQKNLHDTNRKDVTFALGEHVMIKSVQSTPGLSKKLSLPWHGPYEIVKQTSPTTYLARPLFMGRRRKDTISAHVSRMKLYNANNENSEIVTSASPPQVSAHVHAHPHAQVVTRSGRIIRSPRRYL